MAFLGQLTANEIYSAIYNQIISQRLFDISIAEPTLANKLRADGGLYGDTKLFYSADILGSAAWGNDGEAASLLTLKRNSNVNSQEVKIDKFRQTMITVDEYLSKRAWIKEGSFSQFNGILVGSLTQTKKVFDNGLINTFVGTYESSATAADVTIDISDIPVAVTAADVEATARIKGQRISRAIADVFTQLKDNTREFNELGYMRAYNPEELIMVWNAQALNEITNIDLPTVYHADKVTPMDGVQVPSRYFGAINAASGTTAATNTTVRSLTEQDYTVGTGDNAVVTHVFPGDLLPNLCDYAKSATYTIDPKIVGKLISVEGVPFMSGFEVGTSFFNPKSLTTNHYLTWGYNTLVAIKEKPFITFKLELPEVVVGSD